MWMIGKKIRVRVKNTGIDVTLHAESNFDAIFERACLGVSQPEITLMLRSCHAQVTLKSFPWHANVDGREEKTGLL